MHERALKLRSEYDRQRRSTSSDLSLTREPIPRTWHDVPVDKVKADGLGNLCITDARSASEQIDERTRQQIVKIVLHLFLGNETLHRRTIVFAGIEQPEATPFVTAWTGEILADLSQCTVCLVDANLRSPSLHGCFGLANEEGFADLLRSSSLALEEVTYRLSPNLWLLTAGNASFGQARLIPSETTRRYFGAIREQFQYVLVSAPPICTSVQAVTLGNGCDGVIMIVEHGTKKEIALNARGLLEAGGAPLLGAIMNNRQF